MECDWITARVQKRVEPIWGFLKGLLEWYRGQGVAEHEVRGAPEKF